MKTAITLILLIGFVCAQDACDTGKGTYEDE